MLRIEDTDLERSTQAHLDALVEGLPQDLELNPEGRFRLYRVGDAVASRDIHAAILDSLRLCHRL